MIPQVPHYLSFPLTSVFQRLICTVYIDEALVSCIPRGFCQRRIFSQQESCLRILLFHRSAVGQLRLSYILSSRPQPVRQSQEGSYFSDFFLAPSGLGWLRVSFLASSFMLQYSFHISLKAPSALGFLYQILFSRQV